MSWNSLGRAIRVGTASFVILVPVWLLNIIFPEQSVWLYLTAVFTILAVLDAAFCAVAILLSLAGLIVITCPICNSKGQMVGRDSYTYYHCPKCGDVHAKGFFRARYEVK